MRHIKSIILILTGFTSLLYSSCISETEVKDESETVSANFTIGIDTQTRAAEPLNTNLYDAKMYLYEEKQNEDGSVSYLYVTEQTLESNSVTFDNLVILKNYKAVFLAVPKNQTPLLPDFISTGIIAPYDKATVSYINGDQTETDKDIFRSIVSFRASTSSNTFSTVLTRQNGALEIRLKYFPNLTKIKLHAKGHKAFYLNDGTGGQVITEGDPVDIEVDKTAGLHLSEVRIRLNLLPVEDITSDESDPDFYIEITQDENTQKYPIKSDQPLIPVYPNQVTWLTLTNADGLFELEFHDIDLEDEIWDGWIDNPDDKSSH